MNLDKIKQELESIVGSNLIRYDEPMKNHTSFKVGGPADILVTPETISEISNIIRLCNINNTPYFIMGNGSNLIVKDGGYRGVIIKLTSLNDITIEGNKLTAKAGAFLSKAAFEAYRNSLKGMEFASGIPGTVGGAVAMNAGAYGGEIKDIIESATVLDKGGNIIILSNEQLNLSYRHSVIHDKDYIVVEAVFRLQEGNPEEIKLLMDDLNGRRVAKQPLNYPSAGSTFKRPTGYYAGKLIEDAGLKGASYGGAMVSEKHAGFIINYDNASASDILNLIKKVQSVVKEKFNVELEPEVKIIGVE
ncbi:UDP-N-acetylenolpyruvoylglucosamine reductase [Fervidicella metallireducens AeB]|uniref:UDP-N-acetylenolpyruvoylglucosamine reductase n=1 Tax=Fervidicella metallireducens AeB TaxID=1403537 RepID=A0A017RVK0_9CLOT|nr:UDP-N-acetylmuramate dehydrogenase [Fervidicella metallireducens]EYE88606.1 UDP-N-acetylenolpyruvoylglucosamine reductase [Fervidicella metallireducens AeB]